MKALFSAGPKHGYSALFVMAISIVLMTVDVRSNQLDVTRQWLSYLVSPLQMIVSLPNDGIQWLSLALSERDALLQQNLSLQNDVLVLQQKIQQLAILQADNQRLRQLLGATERFDATYLTAEMISEDPDPFSHQIIINRGAQDGVYVGQAILDATGLFGQVIQVNSLTSRVLLVADANHSVPVQINRNGMRSVLVGTGNLDEVNLEFVPNTADIRIGDLLMTSGLAGRFPRDFPVAEVKTIEYNNNEPFATIKATPLAKLSLSRSLLLVFKRQSPTLYPSNDRDPS